MNELNLADLPSRVEAEKRFESRVSNWAMRKFLTTNLERTAQGGWAWQINLPVLTDAIPVLEKNLLHVDDRYAGPTRFIVGGKSTYVKGADHGVIHRHFPAAEITVLPDTGHNPHMEAREAFVAAVRA
jgi:pimeloyl-ACP methyl ester carboxylesterase